MAIKKTRYTETLEIIKRLHLKPSDIESDTEGYIPASWIRDMKTLSSGQTYADRLDFLHDYCLEAQARYEDQQAKNKAAKK